MCPKRVIICFSFFVLAFFNQANGQQKAKNVIFIAIDDLNNWIGAMGGQAITPNIDALAKEGRLFTNAHCVVPACNPSRVAIMTGQRPETTGQFENAGNFRNNPGGKDRLTLPQRLQQKGYETVAAGKLFHQPFGNGKMANELSDPQSWTYQNPGQTGTPGHNLFLDKNGQAKWLEGAAAKYKDAGNGGMSYMAHAGVWGAILHTKEQTGDWQMATFAANYLQTKHEKPFFLAYGVFRPHSPQLAPKEYFDKYPLDKIILPALPEGDMLDIPDVAQTNFSSPFVALVKGKNEYKKAVQAYLACMTFADDCVGQVLNALNTSEYKDNTIVVLWSDHGWQLAHKNRWEKFTLWHQATNAPMIISYPGMEKRGEPATAPVSYLDIYPTVLDILDMQKPNTLEGESLKPLLIRPNALRDIPAVVTYPRGSYAIKLNDWNYIRYKDGSEELYNHLTDWQEFDNLAKDRNYASVIENFKKFIPNDTGLKK